MREFNRITHLHVAKNFAVVELNASSRLYLDFLSNIYTIYKITAWEQNVTRRGFLTKYDCMLAPYKIPTANFLHFRLLIGLPSREGINGIENAEPYAHCSLRYLFTCSIYSYEGDESVFGTKPIETICVGNEKICKTFKHFKYINILDLFL